MVKPLMAPPVPNKPAEKPDKVPPTMALPLEGLNVKVFLMRKRRLNPTRKTPRNTSSQKLLTNLERYPPQITNATEGAPI